ncbi:hypothetical protein ACJX0J_005949 [Zea mays]
MIFEGILTTFELHNEKYKEFILNRKKHNRTLHISKKNKQGRALQSIQAANFINQFTLMIMKDGSKQKAHAQDLQYKNRDHSLKRKAHATCFSGDDLIDELAS